MSEPLNVPVQDDSPLESAVNLLLNYGDIHIKAYQKGLDFFLLREESKKKIILFLWKLIQSIPQCLYAIFPDLAPRDF